jgi:RHS repeat-associated protein
MEYEGDVLEAQVYFYHKDLLGSPICVTDIDGNVAWKGDYEPFGEPLQDIDTVYWGNAYTYLGNEDDGGLMYFHVRYYAKELGRFMSCDPIKDMVSSALTINPYVYCGNNPIVFKDPMGLRAAPGPNWGDDEPGGMPSWAGQGGYHGFDTWQYGTYGPVGAMRGCWPTVERWFKFMSFVMNAMGVQEEGHNTIFVNDKRGLSDEEQDVVEELLEEQTGTDVQWVDSRPTDMDESSQIYGEILGEGDIEGITLHTDATKDAEAKAKLREEGAYAVYIWDGHEAFYIYWPTVIEKAYEG